MIRVTRFNGTIVYLNPELIQTVEATPDTVVRLTNSTKILVKETPQDLYRQFIAYQRLVRNPQLPLEPPTPDSGD